MHGALVELAGSSTTTTSKIAAVILVADPLKVENENDRHEGTADASAEGIWPWIYRDTFDEVGPIPGALLGRTITLCNKKDIVCAPAWDGGGSFAVHGAYHGAELTMLGTWAAEQELNGA